jgi:hypothetical protein
MKLNDECESYLAKLSSLEAGGHCPLGTTALVRRRGELGLYLDPPVWVGDLEEIEELRSRLNAAYNKNYSCPCECCYPHEPAGSWFE